MATTDPMDVCAVRLSKQDLELLDNQEENRSQAIRDAIREAYGGDSNTEPT